MTQEEGQDTSPDRTPVALYAPGIWVAHEDHGLGEIVAAGSDHLAIRFRAGIESVAIDSFAPEGFVILGHRLHPTARPGTVTPMEDEFYWCVEHDRVEVGDGRCPRRNLLGPYPDLASAERALDTVQRRNEIADAEDKRWE